MKKLLSFFCIVAMLLTIVQVPAFAEEGDVVAPTLVRLDLSKNKTVFSSVGDNNAGSTADAMTGTIVVNGVYSDESVRQLIDGVTYASSDTSVLNVEPDGSFELLKEGMAVVTVKYGEIENSMVLYRTDKKLYRRTMTSTATSGDVQGYQDPVYSDRNVMVLDGKDYHKTTQISKTQAPTSYVTGMWIYDSFNGNQCYFKFGGGWLTENGTFTTSTSGRIVGFGTTKGSDEAYVILHNSMGSATETPPTLIKTGDPIPRSEGWHHVMAFVDYNGKDTTKIDFYFDGKHAGTLTSIGKNIVPQYIFLPKAKVVPFTERIIAPYTPTNVITVTGIEATAKDGASLVYKVGESLNKEDIIVNEIYSDGSKKEITNYTITPESFTTAGEQNVIITSDEFTTTLPVNVIGIKSIAATQPTKQYKAGDRFDTEDITVTAVYEDESTSEITDYELSSETIIGEGEQVIKISYKGFETSVTVMVQGITELKLSNAKTAYSWGDMFDMADVKVTAVYGELGEVEVPEYEHTAPAVFETAGTQPIEISYGGKTAAYDVTVYAIESLNAEDGQKIDYYYNSSFSKKSVVVTATDTNGTTKVITDYSYTPNKVFNSTDDQEIEITYGGQKTTYTVAVHKFVEAVIEQKKDPSEYVFNIGEGFTRSKTDAQEDEKLFYIDDWYKLTMRYDDYATSGKTYTVNSAWSIIPAVFTEPGEAVTVRIGFKGVYGETTVKVNELEAISVAEALNIENPEQLVKVEGYYVGVSRNATDNKVYELLLKDIETDAIISVRSSKCTANSSMSTPEDYKIYGSYPDFGYTKGDRIALTGYIKTDDVLSGYNVGKKILSFDSSVNPSDIANTIISSGNTVEFKLDNVTTISSWGGMQAAFKEETIAPYTYFKFTGSMYQNCEPQHRMYTIHMNPNATSADEAIYTEEYKEKRRKVALRNNAMSRNLYNGWYETLFGTQCIGSLAYPGSDFNNEFYAVYVGSDTEYFHIVILDEDWILKDASDNIKVENGNITVKTAAPGEYKVVITQYENDAMKNIEMIPVTTTEFGAETAVTRIKDFELSAGTKVMLFKGNFIRMAPYSKVYIVE